MASDVEKLFLTYIVQERDLLKIWGQTNRTCGLFIDEKLSQLESEFLNSAPPRPDRIYRGMFCFAKYKDSTYYRARVISEVQGTKVRVYFIDFGNKDYVDISDIRVETPNSAYFTKMVDQAESFILAHVVAPIGGWSKEVLSALKQRLCYEDVPYRIVGVEGEERIIQIYIENQDISAYLCAEKMAREISLDVQKSILQSYLTQFSKDMSGRLNNFSQPPPGMQQPQYAPNPVQPQQISTDRPRVGNLPPKQGTFRQSSEPQINPMMPINLAQPVPHNPGQNPMNIQPNVQTPNVQAPPLYRPPLQNQPFINSQNNEAGISIVNPLVSPAVIKALAEHIKEQMDNDSLKTKKEAPTFQHYEQPALEVGSAHNVYVSYVEDGPWSFCVQLLENEKHLDAMMNRISNAKLIPIKRPITLGRPCLARSVECGTVNRGVVVNVTHSSIKVFYVDFGHTEDIPVGNVFETPSEFLQINSFSYKFALCGLQKVPVCSDIKGCFKDVVADQLMMLRVTSLEGESLPTCELYLKDKNVKRILNDSLRLLRLMSAEDFPQVGATEKVVVTWVESPIKFFVNLKRKDGELEQLKEQLTKLAPKSAMLSSDQLKNGQACICLYSGDQQWYRAVISSVESEDCITVFYVDYGNVDTVSASALRKIESGNLISKMGTQAMRCSLKEFLDRPITEEISNTLESMLLEKTVDLKVISHHEREFMVVKIFDNGIDVAQALLNPPTPTPALTPPRDPPYPPKFKTAEPVQTESDDWGESQAEPQQNIGGNRSFNRNDRNDRNDRSDDRNRFGNRPRRFNEGDDDSQNKNSFEKARENWRDKDDNFRSNNRRDETTSDWGNSKSPNEDRNQRSENNFDDRRRFNDRGHQKQEETTSGWDNSKSSNEYSDRNQRSGESNFNDRKRFDDRGNFERKKRFSGGEDDSGEKKDWGNKPRGDNDSWGNKPRGGENDSWGSKPRGGDNESWGNKPRGGDNDSWGNKPRGGDSESWGNKPRGDNDFGDRKRFDNKDGDDKDKFQKKFGDRPPKFPVKRYDAAPDGSKWAEEYIENGSKHIAIVTYFTNPDDFYVQMLDNQEEFKTMMNEIQTYYADKFWMRDPPKEGDICIAKFPVDRVLYRALVISSSPLTVQYVDYGNSESVGNRDVFVVDKKFLDLPKQAVKCKQLKIAPLEGGSWPPSGGDIDKFFEHEVYSCNFVNHITEDNDFFEVELESGGKDIAEEIIAAGLAVASGAAAAEVAAGGEAAESAPIPALDLSLLVNQKFNFYIPYIESLSKFYIYVYPTDADIIQGKVDAFVADEKNFVQLGRENFEVGRLCISTNGTDMWFRARFLEVTDTGAKITFIDYGDSADVTDDQVIIISEELAELPAQAIECSLYGATDDIDQAVHDEFKTTYEGQELVSFVNSFTDNRLLLTLYDAEGNKLEIVKDINDSPASIEPLTAPRIAHQQTPVFISHFDSPSEIFIQRQCDDEPIQTLSAKLNEFYEANGEAFDPALPESESKLCAGKSLADDSWYRCRLISATEGNALVQYIDYGNSEELPVENLKKFDAQFYTSCCYARKVALYADFEEEKLEEVGNRIQDGLIDKPLIAFFKIVDDVTYAELQESGLRFTDLLISEGLCTRKEDIFDGFEFVTEVAEPVQEAVPEQGEVGATDQVVEEASGEGEIVFVSHADSCYDFYVQKNADTEQINDVTAKLESAGEFEDVAVVKVGEMYAALFPDDELWYRAQIEKSEDETEVFFVDYGNKSMVTQIKKLPEELAQIPNLAHSCELAYPDNGCDWTQEECFNKFAEYIGKEVRMFIVLENDNKKFVKLYDGDNSIADLIQEPSETLLPGITVVHINSIVDFYVQYSDEAERLDQIAELIADVENFEDLEDKTPGTKCVAKFPDDDQWYRAVVLTDSGDSCEVEFLDYGNTAIVSEIKKSNDDIDAIEKLAYRCALSEATGNEPEAIQTEFSEFLTNVDNVFATDFSPKQPDSVARIRIFWNGVDYGKYLSGKKMDGAVETAQDEVLETDDDKIRVHVVIVNETDEEKSVKARQSTEGTSEGFKSDDEKTENVAVPNVVNVPDNELIAGQEEELDDSVQIIEERIAEPEPESVVDSSACESSVASEMGPYEPRPNASATDSSAWDKSQVSMATETEAQIIEENIAEPETQPETSSPDVTECREIELESGVITEDDPLVPRSDASIVDSSACESSVATDTEPYEPRPNASAADSSAWDKSQASLATETEAQIIEEKVAEPESETQPDTPSSDVTEYKEIVLESGVITEDDSNVDSSICESSVATETDYLPRPEASASDSSAWDKSQIKKEEAQSPAESDRDEGQESDEKEEEGEEKPEDGSPVQSDEKVDEPSPAQSELDDDTNKESDGSDPKEKNFDESSSQSGCENSQKGDSSDQNVKKEDSDENSNDHLMGGKTSPERPLIKQEVESEQEVTPQMNGNHHSSEESFSPVIKKEETEIKTDGNCTPIRMSDSKFKSEVVGTSQTLPRNRSRRSDVEKIVPGSVSRGVSAEELEHASSSTPIPKTPHSEKVVPGSISRGISFELVYSDSQDEDDDTIAKSSVSAPVTPSPSRKSMLPNYKKVSHQDKIVPGCAIGSPVAESEAPKYEKKPLSEHIIPGVVMGSSSTDDS